MSAEIEIHFCNHFPEIAPTSEPLPPVETSLPETPRGMHGNENGSVFFALDWQNQQANNRRDRVTDGFFGGDSSAGNNYGEISLTEDLFGDHGNHRVENLTERLRQNHSGNSPENRWDELFDRAGNHEDFNEFPIQSKDFRQKVREISKPRTIQIEADDKRETRVVSRYEEILTAAENADSSPGEFAETLPPAERKVFLARFQLDETFGAGNLPPQSLESDELIFSPNSIENRFSDLPRENAVEISPGILTDDETAAINNINTFDFADPNLTENNLPFTEKSKPEETIFVAPIDNVASNPASGANVLLTESSAARAINNVGSESSIVNAAARRESGVVLGGALINGAFSSIGEYQQLESGQIGNSSPVNSFYDAGDGGFSAGATGSMMSAAVGHVIPGAGTDVSGILGFVSGVVVGVEVDAGLRWLGADRTA